MDFTQTAAGKVCILLLLGVLVSACAIGFKNMSQNNAKESINAVVTEQQQNTLKYQEIKDSLYSK